MTEEARKLADELAEWKQAASVEAGLRREFQEAEAKLGAAYLRLRTLIPGAFDTPHAPTGEQVWETTEKALIAALRSPAPGTLAREEVAQSVRGALRTFFIRINRSHAWASNDDEKLVELVVDALTPSHEAGTQEMIQSSTE